MKKKYPKKGPLEKIPGQMVPPEKKSREKKSPKKWSLEKWFPEKKVPEEGPLEKRSRGPGGINLRVGSIDKKNCSTSHDKFSGHSFNRNEFFGAFLPGTIFPRTLFLATFFLEELFFWGSFSPGSNKSRQKLSEKWSCGKRVHE